MGFYTRLEKICRDQGVSLSQVREDLGIRQSTMASWKSRNLTPKYGTVQKIAAYLGVPGQELVEDWATLTSDALIDAFIYSEPIRRVANNMQQLNPAGRQRVEAYSEDMLKIAEYREECSPEAPESPSALQGGKEDTPPPPDAPETPPEDKK